MRTSIVLNDNLVKEAFRYTDVTTKQELIELALKEFVLNHRRRDIEKLRGKINISDDYNHKKQRTDSSEE